MILTITYHGKNTQDLGYLLYKNPYRPQSVELPMGKAHIFFPDISDEKTTVALMLELDPLLLSKGKPGTGEAGLFDYVNDRPYVSSSFMSGAMVKAFGTAMTGRCDSRQDLADSELQLEACVYMLPVRGDKSLIKRFWEPLGYDVDYDTFPIDERFPSWGESPYVNLHLKGKKKLSELLNQLYVLIPVFDLQKHYYVSEAEIGNLIKHGGDWLRNHPDMEYIARRYFSMAKSYAKIAIERLSGKEDDIFDTEMSGNNIHTNVYSSAHPIEEQDGSKDQAPLDKMRLETVKYEVLRSGAHSVIDIGCGEGKLLALLIGESQIEKLAGTDVSLDALAKANKRMEHVMIAERQREKLSIFQGSLMYKDDRFLGYDTACVIEVIEHVEPEKLPVLEDILFGATAPGTVIITTPNRDFNANYALDEDELRHADHRFEWGLSEFSDWCNSICDRYGYTVEISGIGAKEGVDSYPTQMGVFRK